MGLQADLNSRLSAFRRWLLLFLWRGVRGDTAGWDGVSTISNLMRFFFCKGLHTKESRALSRGCAASAVLLVAISRSSAGAEAAARASVARQP